MPLHDDEENKVLAEQIIRYLDSHPEAADGPEGIAMWWIPRQQHKESVEKVNKALDYLIDEGVVHKKRLHNGSFVYSAVKAKTNDDQ